MSKPVRLLLVDTVPLLRRCLAAQLNRRRNLQVIADTGTGSEARGMLHSLQPDVVVVDPQVPEGGPQLVADLCRGSAGCAVLVLTAETESVSVSRMFQAGARGYVLKTADDYGIDEFAQAVQRIHERQLVVSPEIADGLLKATNSESSRGPGLSGLTSRELEVLQLVVEGRSNPQIARELCITAHTAKGHLAKILRKLGLENRVKLVVYALQHKIVRTT